MRIRSDVAKCQGYGNCAAVDADHFDLDDDGMVILVRDTVHEGEAETVADAVRSCPVAAIWVDDGAA